MSEKFTEFWMMNVVDHLEESKIHWKHEDIDLLMAWMAHWCGGPGSLLPRPGAQQKAEQAAIDELLKRYGQWSVRKQNIIVRIMEQAEANKVTCPTNAKLRHSLVEAVKTQITFEKEDERCARNAKRRAEYRRKKSQQNTANVVTGTKHGSPSLSISIPTVTLPLAAREAEEESDSDETMDVTCEIIRLPPEDPALFLKLMRKIAGLKNRKVLSETEAETFCVTPKLDLSPKANPTDTAAFVARVRELSVEDNAPPMVTETQPFQDEVTVEEEDWEFVKKGPVHPPIVFGFKPV